MKREMVAAVTAVAIVCIGGCSSNSKPAKKVTVDGQDQQVQGDVSCTAHDDSLAITIGDPANGVVAMLTGGDSPEVQTVVFGDVDGAKLMYAKEMPVSGDAVDIKATKDGKHYTITGTASELKTVPHPESKPFEIDVTCP